MSLVTLKHGLISLESCLAKKPTREWSLPSQDHSAASESILSNASAYIHLIFGANNKGRKTLVMTARLAPAKNIPIQFGRREGTEITFRRHRKRFTYSGACINTNQFTSISLETRGNRSKTTNPRRRKRRRKLCRTMLLIGCLAKITSKPKLVLFLSTSGLLRQGDPIKGTPLKYYALIKLRPGLSRRKSYCCPLS